MLLCEKSTPLLDNWTSNGLLRDYISRGAMRLALTDEVCEAGFVQPPLFNSQYHCFIPPKNDKKFVVTFIVPTGVGASIGGHAGDATPTLHMISQVADLVLTHPNVVNASDVNELPHNAWYIEGSLLSRLLCGHIGLKYKRSNKVLVILCCDKLKNPEFKKLAICTVDGAKATYGLNCDRIVILDDIDMKIGVSEIGRAIGSITELSGLTKILDKYKLSYDAIAIASHMVSPEGIVKEYFQSHDEEINPWGGVEALLTHYISSYTNLPSAHAPIDIEDFHITNIGSIDPRKAIEAISTTFFQCVLKGLKNAPQVIPLNSLINVCPDTITAGDIDVIVMPAGCVGIPNLAADLQNILVIGVKDDICIPKSSWTPKLYIEVDNYREATGVLAAMKAGLSVDSVFRPLKNIEIENYV